MKNLDFISLKCITVYYLQYLEEMQDKANIFLAVNIKRGYKGVTKLDLALYW